VKKLFLNIVPKKFISKITSYLSELTIPFALRNWVYTKYSSVYGVNLLEIEKDISEYNNFSKFFTRNLKKGSRIIQDQILVSPVDAVCVEQGTVNENTLIQAKGIKYSLDELFNNSRLRKLFSNGNQYWTFYLAPGDYHNIHSPCSGKITSLLYVPGDLYPVNNFSRYIIPNLYIKNERVISIVESEDLKVAVIKVGAMNVGSIGVEYLQSFREECRKKKLNRNLIEFRDPIEISKGEKLGTFYLGSTVIVIANGINSKELPSKKDKKVYFGEGLLL
jgi:phosphatidylserine decarboxylase